MTSITKINQLSPVGGIGDHLFSISENGSFVYVVNQKILLGSVESNYPLEIVELNGHHSKVTQLCFGSRIQNEYLVSAGSFYIILWDLSKIRKSHESNQEIRGRVIAQIENSPTIDLTLSADIQRICVANKYEITVHDVESKSVVWSKFGKSCTKALFLEENIIIFITKSSCIEAWCIDEETLIWKSENFSSEILFLWKETSNRFGVGCSNNSVTVYSRSLEWKKVFTIDLDMEMFRYNSALSKEQSANSQVVAIFPANLLCLDTEDQNLENGQIICATSQSISIINSQTQEVEILPFPLFNVDFISAISFAQKPDSSILSITVPLFKDYFEVIKIKLNTGEQTIYSISVIPHTPLIDDSILKKTLTPSKRTSKAVNRVAHNPITFHDKIRSSGYHKKPENRKMFQPLTSKSSAPKQQAKHVSNAQLLMDCDIIIDWSQQLQNTASINVCDRPSNVNHMTISECNRYLSCAFSNSTCVILGRKSRKHIVTFRGHDASINNCYWNYDSTVVLTSSSDCSAKMWDLSNPDQPIMNLRLKYGCFSKNTEKFTKQISHGQFYYMDKFLMLSFGNSFGLYSYHIDHSPKDDVKRYKDKNKYKLAKLFSLSGAQSVTCMTCPNNIYSYITLTCGSDKTVNVFDMNTAVCCRKIENAHTRPISHLTLNTGSSYSQPVNYDLILTTAPTDGIKLWDLRSSNCSLKFKSHPDNYLNPFAVTPNGHYLATAGDDKRIHIYDIRKMELVQSTLQEKDKVSSLCFSKDATQLHVGLRTGDISVLSKA